MSEAPQEALEELPKKERAAKEEEEPPGAPEWVVTFTDMISLLVTFFVLLMTFSSMDEYDLLQIQGVLPGSKGSHDPIAMHRLLPPPEDDLVANTDPNSTHPEPHSRPDEQVDEQERPGASQDEDQLLVDLTQIEDGLLIQWGAEYSFAPGSAELPEKLGRALDELALTLAFYPHLVVVEGHADQDHRGTPSHPDALAMSVARALAGAERLVAGGVEASRVQVTGHGADRPLQTGATVAARRANRRVELRIATLDRARAEVLAEQIRARQLRGASPVGDR